MDGKQLSKKLVGNDEERAVSPVIGVILMVAITVILAAVIAAFVLDIGDDMGSGTVDAAVTTDVSYDGGDLDEIQIEVTTADNVDQFDVRGDYEEDDIDISSTGDVTTIDGSSISESSGTINIIAISGDDESQAGSAEWDED
ncbi:type IV pilin [Natronorubrum sp. DTA28]|uniref:type IV pilin n=1 Tax=Natronorubrum sp. DTA28 TaxID=3447019 RepID=UPI003F839674